MLNPFFKSDFLEAGIDEAGRGCLAGPVVGAAIIFNVFEFRNEKKINNKETETNNISYFLKTINDSKQLTEKTRFELKPSIEQIAVSFSISFQDAKIIDEINILNASLQSMRESILALKVIPIYIIVDGNQPLTPTLPVNKGEIRYGDFNEIPYACIVKGDSKYISIAAASVLAKTYRDLYMDMIHEEFPMYNWKKNKGYPTKEHREAIRNFGVTKYHRHSFRWLPEMTNEEFLIRGEKMRDERCEM